MTRALVVMAAITVVLPGGSIAQIQVPPGLSLAGHITLAGLGVVPQPSAIEFSANGSTLYISGAGNTPAGLIYALPVVRQPGSNRILGFGYAVPFAPAPYIDAGLQFGPNGVLFFTEFPVNKLGEIVNGVLYEFPLPPETSSTGGLVFVPPGPPNAGALLISNFNNGNIYAVDLTPNPNGSYTPTTATLYATAPVIYSEALRFVPVGPYVGDLLLADFNWPDGHVRRFDIDPLTGLPFGGATTPVVSDVITNFPSLDGMAFDPITHDLFVTDWDAFALFQFTGFTTLQSLVADRSTLPVAGGIVHFDLRAGTAHQYQGHILGVSASGTFPGTPIGLITVPLNIDAVTLWALNLANTSLFANFSSLLSVTGEGMAALQVPGGFLSPPLAGLTLDFAALLLYPEDFATNAVSVTIVL